MKDIRYFCHTAALKTRNMINRSFNIILKQPMESFSPLAIIKMDGGLASQMWQYSLGQAIKKNSDLKIKYDLSWFRNSGMTIDGSRIMPLEIHKTFANIDIEEASEKEIEHYKKNYFVAPIFNCVFSKEIIRGQKPKYLGSYYCNIRYIDASDLQRSFNLKLSTENLRILEIIHENTPSIAIHIRRGDFVRSIHDVTTPEYFLKAIGYVAERLSPKKPVFFVFSNDMGYAKEITSSCTDWKFYYINNNDQDNGRYDMYLMHQCDHHIISNSGFGWWAAYLKQVTNHLTVMPSTWLNKKAPVFLRYRSETAYIFDGCVRIDP